MYWWNGKHRFWMKRQTQTKLSKLERKRLLTQWKEITTRSWSMDLDSLSQIFSKFSKNTNKMQSIAVCDKLCVSLSSVRKTSSIEFAKPQHGGTHCIWHTHTHTHIHTHTIVHTIRMNWWWCLAYPKVEQGALENYITLLKYCSIKPISCCLEVRVHAHPCKFSTCFTI